MDFILNDEQRQIYDYGGQLAQKFDNDYWLRHARKHEATYTYMDERNVFIHRQRKTI